MASQVAPESIVCAEQHALTNPTVSQSVSQSVQLFNKLIVCSEQHALTNPTVQFICSTNSLCALNSMPLQTL